MSDSEKGQDPQKLSEDSIQRHCNFFVKRKKRYCRMTVKESEIYCCEHQNEQTTGKPDDNLDSIRIPCPLDNKQMLLSGIPQYLCECLRERSVERGTYFRQDTFTIPLHHTSRFKGCYLCTAPHCTNMMQDSSGISPCSFKRRIKEILLKKKSFL